MRAWAPPWAWRVGGASPPPPGPARGCGDATRGRSQRLVHGHSCVRAPRVGPDARGQGQLLTLVRAGPAQTSARHALTVVRATPVTRPGQQPGHLHWASTIGPRPWPLRPSRGLENKRHLENEATCLSRLLIIVYIALELSRISLNPHSPIKFISLSVAI